MGKNNAQDSQSEVTIVVSLNVTDVIKVSKDEDKATAQTTEELKRLISEIQKISGVDHLEITKTKVYPNLKE